MHTSRDQWERLLNPKVLRNNLIVASLFITVFEILNDSIVDRIRYFFTNGFYENGLIIDKEYAEKVLSRNRSPVYASLDWLRENSAIDASDIHKFDAIKKCRNEIVHELPKLIQEGPGTIHKQLFEEAKNLLDKIEKWWIVNVEIPTNADMDGQEVDEAGISPGSVIMIDLLTKVAFGPENEAASFYNMFFPKSKEI
jgi:hypothetical protein